MLWMLLSVLVGSADAGEGTLAWEFSDGEQHRYTVENQVDLSATFEIFSETNERRRLMGWNIGLNLLCSGVTEKKATTLRCTIEDLALRVRTLKADELKIKDVLDEWDQKLVGADMVMVFGRDGRMKRFDLEGVKNELENVRSREMRERMRLMLERSAAAFEVPLPKKGGLEESEWLVKELRVLAVPSMMGNSGGARAVAKKVKASEKVAEFSIDAKGVRGPNINSPNSERIANLWSFKAGGTAKWLLSEGVLLSHEMVVEANLTPSSDLANDTTFPYIQAFSLQRYAPGRDIEAFGENGLIDVAP